MTEGLSYKAFTYHKSKVHLLTVDLSVRRIKPILDAEAFPFLRIYPIYKAIDLGALACIGDGFNTTWFHNQGVADQPLHAMVIDEEIWTTGVGNGGVGLFLGDGVAYVQTNLIDVHVWGDGQAARVTSVNLKHDRISAFTPRGGTNDVPDPTKHLYTVGNKTIESRWRLPFTPTEWKQSLGVAGITDIVSGWPLLVQGGANVVPLLGLHGVASHGPDNWFIRKNPRTAVGVSQDHKTVYVCTVEGRIPSSPGLRLKEFATMLLRHGVWDAVNFDGGGSAFMWLKGKLVADSCYGNGTLEGLRPDHWSLAVF